MGVVAGHRCGRVGKQVPMYSDIVDGDSDDHDDDDYGAEAVPVISFVCCVWVDPAAKKIIRLMRWPSFGQGGCGVWLVYCGGMLDCVVRGVLLSMRK